MPEPTSGSVAASGLLFKYFGAQACGSAIAVALGFLFLWPRSLKEAFVRIASTILASSLFGPALTMLVHSWWPGMFDSARAFAIHHEMPEIVGVLFVSTPVITLAGLPAWWILGALVLWFESRRGKDIGEMAGDAASLARGLTGAKQRERGDSRQISALRKSGGR